MIFSTREFWREFLYPHLHRVMDFPFPFSVCFSRDFGPESSTGPVACGWGGEVFSVKPCGMFAEPAGGSTGSSSGASLGLI